ncbi:MAG TPA: hypothetical protein DCQ59_00075 [Verrucomicrobiales bacterium]|nr:hypothetical protein [Verrucomicrobiales bacterium]
MNTTNFLLGTTSILIVVAFILSFGGFNEGRDSQASKDELAKLTDAIEQLAAENRALERNYARTNRPNNPATSVSTTAPPAGLPVAPGPATSNPDSESLGKIKELEDKNRALEEKALALEEENDRANEERRQITIEQNMAAKKVQMAMDMGTVKSANKEQAIVIYEPSANAPSFQPSRILAIRRNTGIIGTIVIERLDASGQYIATMRPHGYSPDGYPDIQPGDTVIVDPNG